jgi:hypothetical protein
LVQFLALPIDRLSVLVAVACGALFFGEKITGGVALGALLVLAGSISNCGDRLEAEVELTVAMRPAATHVRKLKGKARR